MFTHCVFFWLKEETPREDRDKFEEGLRSLTTIPGASHATFGVPATTDRPVVERSYSYGLMVRLDDLAAHDAYQVHPVHKEFLKNCAALWSRVQVYDFVDPLAR
jgi:stress responsive alpha/beta barrel protein